MTAPDELKPCPFCGGGASHNGGGNSVFGRLWWVVGCEACDIWMSDPEIWDNARPGMLHPGYPPKHCFAAWNRRADLVAAKDAEIARLQARLAACPTVDQLLRWIEWPRGWGELKALMTETANRMEAANAK